MAAFENVFVVGEKISHGHNLFEKLSIYICDNYINNKRFTQDQIFRKIHDDAIEYFGKEEAQYKEAILLREVIDKCIVKKYKKEIDIDEMFGSFDIGGNKNLNLIQQSISGLSVNNNNDNEMVCTCCNPKVELVYNQEGELLCPQTGMIH